MKALVILCAFLALAACGADGDPVQPGGSVDASGDVRIGVVGGL